MNIGIDIRSLLGGPRTGVGEYTYGMVKALLDIDKENQYFLFSNSSSEPVVNSPDFAGENVHLAHTRYPNKFFNAGLQVFRKPKLDKLAIKNSKLAHPSGLVPPWYQAGEFKIKNLDYWFSPNLNFTSISKNTKHIITIHDLSFEMYPECFSHKRQLWHKFLKPKKQCEEAHIILTPSESTKQGIVDIYGINRDKIKVIYPGLSSQEGLVEKSHVAEKYGLPEKFILFLGTIEPRKNIIGLIEAYGLADLEDYKLVIAGPEGWKCKQILKKIKNTKDVQYLGYVDESEKADLYKLASLFVYPSLYEGFGFPPLEAMAAGTPVIASDRYSLPEVLGDVAVFVNPYKISEIAGAMKRLVSNDELHKFYVQKGLIRVDIFNWDLAAREFLSILNKY